MQSRVWKECSLSEDHLLLCGLDTLKEGTFDDQNVPIRTNSFPKERNIKHGFNSLEVGSRVVEENY